VELEVVKVAGWDEKCSRFASAETQARLIVRAIHLAFLRENSTEHFLLRKTDGTPVLFVGLMRTTLLGGEAYIWMIPFTSFNVHCLREAKRLFVDQAKKFTKLTAQILPCEQVPERFLRFFGFEAVTVTPEITFYERIS